MVSIKCFGSRMKTMAASVAASKLYKVFVYGTLKRGEPNHECFSKCKDGYHKFLCEAETVEKYPLIIGTRFNIPFLLHNPGKGFNVMGEVYEVDERVLADLDELEDHPNYYCRNEFMVRPLLASDGRSGGSSTSQIIKMPVWIYFIHNFRPELLERTTYRSYSNNGDHGLKYVSSEMSTVDDLNNI
ncbi:PREDICTED: gamma-glutamylaminecyclotransferase C isoform X2 [Nicrophorus vespilloides]|uniref:Gamma-glutamylcyclotransferase family protein n=1 Tax=Nicrophorus vespilloides TaxID=110193 RepID=A0ABM1M1R7_NICVS|nr:PREDICTED: gamma-glutamylaminecyclotransferase C isoform X2 [Nicrophorus vespilloides]